MRCLLHVRGTVIEQDRVSERPHKNVEARIPQAISSEARLDGDWRRTRRFRRVVFNGFCWTGGILAGV